MDSHDLRVRDQSAGSEPEPTVGISPPCEEAFREPAAPSPPSSFHARQAPSRVRSRFSGARPDGSGGLQPEAPRCADRSTLVMSLMLVKEDVGGHGGPRGVKDRGTRPPEAASGEPKCDSILGDRSSLRPADRHGILGRSEQTIPGPGCSPDNMGTGSMHVSMFMKRGKNPAVVAGSFRSGISSRAWGGSR